jgi:hypothetical protein
MLKIASLWIQIFIKQPLCMDLRPHIYIYIEFIRWEYHTLDGLTGFFKTIISVFLEPDRQIQLIECSRIDY